MKYIFLTSLWLTSAYALQIDSPKDAAKLFARGKAALADLEKIGAKKTASIVPTRKDIIYSLIADEIPDNARKDSFGLHFKRQIFSEDQARLEREYSIKIDGRCDRYAHPACYATVAPGQSLSETMKAVLSREPNVLTVNFNSVEKTQKN